MKRSFKIASAAIVLSFALVANSMAQETPAADERTFILKKLGSGRNVVPSIKPTWTVESSSYSNWISGDVGGCEEWSPSPSIIDEGISFEQSRACEQIQNRTRIDTLISNRVEGSRQGAPTMETRIVPITQRQDVLGTRPVWVTIESTYGEWVDTGEVQDSGDPWLPALAEQNESFSQTRSAQTVQKRQVQARERHPILGEVRDVGEPVEETRFVPGQITRDVAVTRTAWSVSARNNCDNWSPASVQQENDFSQDRTCDVTESRLVEYRVSGALISSRGEDIDNTITESQAVTVMANNWSLLNEVATDWLPESIDQTSAYEQVRQVLRDEERIVTHRVSGEDVFTFTQTRDVDNFESRNVAVALTTLSAGDVSPISEWLPAFDNQSSPFTQERQVARQDVVEASHTVDGELVYAGNTFEAKNIVTESRSVSVGFADIQTNDTSYGDWLPEITTQTSNFSQTRQVSQKTADRTYSFTVLGETVYTWVGGVTTPISTENRAVTVSSRFVSATPTVARGTAGWTPSPATQTTRFEQTFLKEAVHIYQRLYAINNGSDQIASSQYSQYVQTQDKRTVEVSKSTVGYDKSNYSAWSPAPNTQTSNYQQTRGYRQTISEKFTYKVNEDILGEYVRPYSYEQTDRRDIDVALVSNEAVAKIYAGDWSPKPSAIDGRSKNNLTQRRGFYQTILETRRHRIRGSEEDIHTSTRQYSYQSDNERRINRVATNLGNTVMSETLWSPSIKSKNFQVGSFDQTKNRTVQTLTRYDWVLDTDPSLVLYSFEDVTGYTNSPKRRVSLVKASDELINTNVTSEWSPNFIGQTSRFTQTRRQTSYYDVKYQIKSADGTEVYDELSRIEPRSSFPSRTVNVGRLDAEPITEWLPLIDNQSHTFEQSRKVGSGKAYIYYLGSNVADPLFVAHENGTAETRTVTVQTDVVPGEAEVADWSPALETRDVSYRSTVPITQYRNIFTPQSITVTYKVGDEVIETVERKERKIQDEFRQLVATTSYVDTGVVLNETQWEPVFDKQDADFYQAKSTTYEREATINYYTYDTTQTGNRGALISQSFFITSPRVVSDQRLVNVVRRITVTDSGSEFTEWSPKLETQNVAFNQRRNYVMRYNYEYTFLSPDSEVLFIHDYDTKSGRTDSRIVTVEDGAQVVTSRVAVSDWYPIFESQTADFSQRRNFEVSFSRVRAYKVDSEVIGTYDNTFKSVTTEVRTVLVTKTPVDSGESSFTPWTPGHGTQSVNYVQSRNIVNDRDYNYVFEYEGNEVYQWTESTGLFASDSESRDVTVNVTYTAKGERSVVNEEILENGSTRITYQSYYDVTNTHSVDGSVVHVYEYDPNVLRQFIEIVPAPE